ncbi:MULTISPECIES: hypothetical protein [unclassified Kaistella]|uniref:hypothetical protein n=1 Tax=unclassified Kaistella TaxID=2762626 RepID=UPI0027333B1C|nr:MULTISPECIES: hypothetical protein [unclassified Kaistella]MDP2453819.1 hypothetical protein [Kaistella sp. SH11-4b]MDP2456876.1 hypothetical protein [Kaistella sp. SH40-3]MDP2459633.1 hypothetical protein [Kaistella sp. SH19-2b]
MFRPFFPDSAVLQSVTIFDIEQYEIDENPMSPIYNPMLRIYNPDLKPHKHKPGDSK